MQFIKQLFELIFVDIVNRAFINHTTGCACCNLRLDVGHCLFNNVFNDFFDNLFNQFFFWLIEVRFCSLILVF
ncbi:Uncharacterised protein [Vibrio cholerae]|nr:Uncharacterised protein [Vibrio cholerae]CSB68988.1 Uncharacterised protein [Vibrio cholerae]CSC28485.1 Uncharacterised protein [Vibrio cholerae]CSC29889.1 Uncharacterised protein [Vibrio cholerae]CSC40172.1 Uncharacterised protein [Vibrio cholerae]